MKYTIEKKDNEYLLILISDSSEYFEKGFYNYINPSRIRKYKLKTIIKRKRLALRLLAV